MANYIPNLISLLGILSILFIGYLASTHRSKIQWRIVICGLALQLAFAIIILKTPIGFPIFDGVKEFVNQILDFTHQGGSFVFGSMANEFGQGGIFAFRVLTTIIFFASLMSVLYYLGIIQWIVVGMAKIMTRLMGVSGGESLSAAANVFVGQTEAPLVVKPYVSTMTTSELMALMTGGFATIAGGVLVAYVAFGVSAGHLLAASIMSAPAALLLAKIFVPETEESVTAGEVKIELEQPNANVVDAAAAGAADGIQLAINVAGMLLAFIALVAMLDWSLSLLKDALLWTTAGSSWIQAYWPGSLKQFFGYVFWPLAWVMGVPAADCSSFGNLLGTKIAVNEFVAYMSLTAERPMTLLAASFSPRAFMIGTYAMCGFANFSSIAIQLGGIGGIAPERRHDLAKLGLKAMCAGAMASFMTACLAGALITVQESDYRYVRDASSALEKGTGHGNALWVADEFILRYQQADPDSSWLKEAQTLREKTILASIEKKVAEAMESAAGASSDELESIDKGLDALRAIKKDLLIEGHLRSALEKLLGSLGTGDQIASLHRQAHGAEEGFEALSSEDKNEGVATLSSQLLNAVTSDQDPTVDLMNQIPETSRERIATLVSHWRTLWKDSAANRELDGVGSRIRELEAMKTGMGSQE
jgi:CNT family concentrative nucleoside transporter